VAALIGVAFAADSRDIAGLAFVAFVVVAAAFAYQADAALAAAPGRVSPVASCV
jgi:hypothetical protein